MSTALEKKSDIIVYENAILKVIVIGSFDEIDEKDKQKIKTSLARVSPILSLISLIAAFARLTTLNKLLCTIDEYRPKKMFETHEHKVHSYESRSTSFASIKHNDVTLQNGEMKGARFEKKKKYKKIQTQKNYKKGTPKHKQRIHHGCKTTSFR